MQNLIKIGEKCKGKHIIELNGLTTYQAAIKKLSTYINLMCLIQDDDGKINAAKIIGMYQNLILNPVILDDDLNEVHYIGGRRRDIELYNEIVGIKWKLDNFLPVSCGESVCNKKARNVFYEKRGEIWKFRNYLCYDHIKPYENKPEVFTAALKISEIRGNRKIPRGMGLREDAFRKILESAGYEGQEVNPEFSREFVLNLKEREPEQTSLFI